jgi:HPt (histidine-containing phosphotransfer) domain-containing protein
MHRFAVRGFIVIPALAALMILAAGCGSSGHTSSPKASPTATHSAPSTTSGVAAACHKIQTTLAKAPGTLGNLALHPSSAKSQVTEFVNKLKTEAANAGSPALSSAVNDFASSVEKALASAQSNPGSITSLISQLTKDSQKIATACKNATG